MSSFIDTYRSDSIPPTRNAYGLTARDMNTLHSILAAQEVVTRVYLYGSRAKGNYHTGSDIDLAIMNEGVSSLLIARMLGVFEESSLPYFVDLLDFTKLPEGGMRSEIMRTGVLLYEREPLASVSDVALENR